jgi:transposase
MRDCTKSQAEVTVGLDLGDKHCNLHVLDADGDTIEESQVKTTTKALHQRFGPMPPSLVVLEAGTHCHWVSRLLQECGHEVLVANPRQLAVIYQNHKKSDKADAEYLARLGRSDPKLLQPIRLRGPGARLDLAVVRARDSLVGVRTTLINHLRGVSKSFGARIPRHGSATFHRKAPESMPPELLPFLSGMLESLEKITTEIQKYDTLIEKQLSKKYPQTEILRQVKGVGAITALAFILIIDDPVRFKQSRTVGAYLGLTPKRSDSGDSEPQLRISKRGDALLRRLLVGSAQYILGPFGEDCDLRRFGEALAQRGGKNAKKRAVVAVARKLATLLHRLWLTGEVYEPLRQADRKRRVAARIGPPAQGAGR